MAAVIAAAMSSCAACRDAPVPAGRPQHEPVERITGRKVRSFLSSTDTEVDRLSMETFVLHPAGCDGPSRINAEA